MNSTQVTWLPEHPTTGSMSMQRYWRLLEGAIQAEDPFECSSIFPPDKGETVRRSGTMTRYLARQFCYPAKIKFQAKGEIVHVLDHSWAEMLRFTPRHALKVVTVHDLIPLRFPGELTPAQSQRFRCRVENLTKADAIIADSAYTKLEIQELLGIDGSKIHVVLLGVKLPEEMNSPSPFPQRQDNDTHFRIGSIGNTLERKNLAILPEALVRLQASVRRKVVLVRVGGMLPASLAAAVRAELGENGLIELGDVPDNAIPGYYADLDALVVPSLYEGFGLPVLEGMAARVPVVSSNSTSLPEVGGENVLYFDPTDPDALAHQLAVVAENRLPEDWTDLAYERAKGFSWRKTLEGIYDVYQGAMDQRSRRSV